MEITAKEVLACEHDAELVRVKGRLVEGGFLAGNLLLSLSDGDAVIQASLEGAGPSSELAKLDPGSRLELTGVLVFEQSQHDCSDVSRLFLRSASDVAVLEGPPWWNTRRAGMALGIVVLLFLAWMFSGLKRDARLKGQHITERKCVEERLQAYSRQLTTLSRQLMNAQEAERRHIARELHDQVGQDLTALIISLRSSKGSSGTAPPSVHLEEGIQLVERMLQRVRDLSLELRPSMLDDLGLAAALRWYLDRQSQRAGLKVHFSAEPPEVRLSPELETTCFRVAQEALTNIVRHARASEVWVDLRRCKESLELVVRDDGIGFDVALARERASLGGSMGLLGMQERASLLGGEIEIESAPERGTELRVRFPLGAFTAERDYRREA